MIKTLFGVPKSTACRCFNRRIIVSAKRSFKAIPDDPRYVFSKPPSSTPLTSKMDVKDGKHFFTPPNSNKGPSLDEQAVSIGNAIASKRRKDRRRLVSLIFISTLAGIFGYTVCYRAMYLKEQSFIPLFPSSRIRKLSERDKRSIDIKQVENVARIRVLEQLSQHRMMKDEYGVPLRDTNTLETPQVQNFEMWCEDQDPCVTGIVIEPNDNRPSTHEWYRVPFFFKWRITHRPISLSENLNDFLKGIGLTTTDIFQVIAPENVYGSFKYEFPIQGDNHSMHIWFLGEMELGNESLIVFKGKYHVDAKLQQIDLLRKENKKLVRYILYKEDEN